MTGTSRPRLAISILGPVVSCTLVLVTEKEAHAGESGTATVGYQHSFIWGSQPGTGHGFEATYVYYPLGPIDGRAVGGFFQGQLATPDDHFGFSIGPQVNFFLVGLELGYAYRGAAAEHATTHGLHVGPFVSFGFVSCGWHAFVPIADSGAGESRGFQHSLTLALKFVLPLHGELPLIWGHGRPLRVGPERQVAAAVVGNAWLEPELAESPDVGRATPALAAWLAEQWLLDARAEHSSIATFARLALNLLALGAPASLVQAAQQAALEETRHARLCFTLANAYSGLARGPARLPAATEPPAPPSYLNMALESLIDGCLGEGIAARMAKASALAARHPRVRSAFEEIARDELSHAGLAWRIVGWCRERGGAVVEVALGDAARRLPVLGDLRCTPSQVSLVEARQFGILSPFEQVQISESVREEVLETVRASMRSAA